MPVIVLTGNSFLNGGSLKEKNLKDEEEISFYNLTYLLVSGGNIQVCQVAFKQVGLVLVNLCAYTSLSGQVHATKFFINLSNGGNKQESKCTIDCTVSTKFNFV